MPQIRTDEIMMAVLGGESGPPVAFPPSASFTSDVTSGDAPLTVQFTDQSSGNPHTWAWGFGDTGSSTQQNPSHVYADMGVYTVSLTATNDEGSDTETKTNYISVVVLPVAEFSGLPLSGAFPLSVQFTDESTGTPTSWLWDFGDTNTSTEQNPLHEYASDGTYTVSLTATNADGQDTETKASYILVTAPLAPTAEFSGLPLSGASPLSVQFTDESTGTPTSWDWDFGDTNTSTAQNPLHEYASEGTYTVTLTATNAGGSDSETKTDYIDVADAPAVPWYQAGGISADDVLLVRENINTKEELGIEYFVPSSQGATVFVRWIRDESDGNNRYFYSIYDDSPSLYSYYLYNGNITDGNLTVSPALAIAYGHEVTIWLHGSGDDVVIDATNHSNSIVGSAVINAGNNTFGVGYSAAGPTYTWLLSTWNGESANDFANVRQIAIYKRPLTPEEEAAVQAAARAEP